MHDECKIFYHLNELFVKVTGIDIVGFFRWILFPKVINRF